MFVVWMGTRPEKCELCSQNLDKHFIDGKTNMGPWAIMCEKCHSYYGYGFGVGKGQKYELSTLKKVEG